MDARQFLTVAGRLTMAKGSGPADYRTAISRAYYGVYHLARQVLTEQLQFYCHDENEHRWVQRHFYNCQLQAAKDVGRLLGNLHEARKMADYELNDRSMETPAQAVFQLERAREIESRLHGCTEAVKLETLRAEMVAYRTKTGVR